MKRAEKSDFPKFEDEMLKAWDDENTFKASLEKRKDSPSFSFYDGPPFANGLPHFGHSLVTAIKDSIGRYKTMRGYYVDRRNGWDTHGLPVEFAIEKELNVSGKKQILEYGLQKFNDACRASVFRYKQDWEDFFKRVGRWTDTDNAYVTMDRDYTESVWWMLGEVNKKQLLYKGYKSMPYCPRCETPLSNFELNEGYKDGVSDPSLYVKFKLVDEDAYLLGWTTTPWSLPGNAAIGVNPKAAYVYVETKDDNGALQILVLAKDRLETLDTEYVIKKEVKASDLVGREYLPLFELDDCPESKNLFKVWASPIVSIEEGTGILHIAPAFGEDDLSLAQENDIPVLTTLKPNGHMTENISLLEARDKFFKGADKLIIASLAESGNVFSAETFEHTYPFCYRCDSPLLYYAVTTWFVNVSSIREDLLETAKDIAWQPNHIKSGRFGKWLEGARDWAISRNRYWGAPLPIWVNESNPDDYIVISSLDQLIELANLDEKPADLHRPAIDEIVIYKDEKTYRRVEEVFDCWFESGAMPVAQRHYPFSNKEQFEDSFPADYIGEGLDQTHLWFYVLHVLSTIAFGKPAYKNVLVNGMVMAADGEKLSKRLKNYPPVDEVFSTEGADSLRLYLLGNDQAVGGGYMRFNRDAMKDIQRNIFSTLWNTYTFLTTYTSVDEWKPKSVLETPTSENLLDLWLLSRLNAVIVEMTESADSYQLAKAIRPMREFIDDLSNWYVRRSRRRFWKSEDDADKNNAYQTLHYVLIRVSQLLAPWSPFFADKLYRGLTVDMNMEKSVHLSDWPEAGTIDQILIDQMNFARSVVSAGLAERSVAGIKVRQPLATLAYSGIDLPSEISEIIAEEVNVKLINKKETNDTLVSLDINITHELKLEGLSRDLIRQIQSIRKATGLEVDDRILLTVIAENSNSELAEAVIKYADTIKSETLAKELILSGNKPDNTMKVGDEIVHIGVTASN
jgi:isoleucyl-tRNA synthetase